MQYFGKYDLGFDKEFLTESYLYVNKEDEEEISIEEFEELIKNRKLKKKNIAGTVIMYNPFVYPLGYDQKKSLVYQEYDKFGEFDELKIEREITLFKPLVKQFPGQLIEIKYLFNLNSHNIDTPERLASLNQDTELLTSGQYTIFDKEMNYLDIPNIVIYGKFVHFAWGTKINKKEFDYIYYYAEELYNKCIQMQKKVCFVYKRTTQMAYAIEHLQFLHPIGVGRYKSRMVPALKNLYAQYPPKSVFFDDVTL
jgi:predicted small secreted protein